jgi:hypothetical protein
MRVQNVRLRALAGACVLLAAAALPVQAHHSVAMFDRDKTITLNGAVKEFQFTNPHAWLQIVVTDPDGSTEGWEFECPGPSALLQRGIKAKTINPGDKVTVVANPMKDGRKAGLMISVTAADGHLYTAM